MLPPAGTATKTSEVLNINGEIVLVTPRFSRLSMRFLTKSWFGTLMTVKSTNASG